MGKVHLSAHKEIGKEMNKNDEMVLTPGGWRPKSKVHYIETGHHISGKGGGIKKINSQTGGIIEDFGAPDDIKRVMAEGRINKAKKKNLQDPSPITDGWIVYSEWTNKSGIPISYFKSTWKVPQPPATENAQLIYLFNGLQQTQSGPFILQPVLQWGASPAGGGNYWSITNWYVDGNNGHAYHGNLVNVNPGDLIEGIISLTSQAGNSFSYLSSFTNYPLANFSIADIDELTWACETLECYGFKAFSDYPNQLLTAFTNIEIKLRTAINPTIIDEEAALNWIADNTVTDNNQQCRIVSNSSPGGEVDLFYRAN